MCHRAPPLFHSPEEIQQETREFSPFLKAANHLTTPMPDCMIIEPTENGDLWAITGDDSLSDGPQYDPDCTRSKEWLFGTGSWRGGRSRTRSISEAELVSPAFLLPEFSGSPVQLPPPPIADLRRSFTLPTRLQPLQLDPDHSTEALHYSHFVEEKDELVLELQKQLEDRDTKMREISEEAMISVSQLHELTAIVMEMKAELDSLKAENDRLQRLVEQEDSTTSNSIGLQPPSTSTSSSAPSPATPQPPATAAAAASSLGGGHHNRSENPDAATSSSSSSSSSSSASGASRSRTLHGLKQIA